MRLSAVEKRSLGLLEFVFMSWEKYDRLVFLMAALCSALSSFKTSWWTWSFVFLHLRSALWQFNLSWLISCFLHDGFYFLRIFLSLTGAIWSIADCSFVFKLSARSSTDKGRVGKDILFVCNIKFTAISDVRYHLFTVCLELQCSIWRETVNSINDQTEAHP